MRISTGALRRSSGRCKVFGQFSPKTLHLDKANEPSKPWLSRLSALFSTHYLALCQDSPVYADIREGGGIGIPCFVLEDGTVTRDLETVLK